MEDFLNYCLLVEYDPQKNDAIRSFEALSQMIKGYSSANQKIAHAIDPNIKTSISIIDLDYSSLRTFLEDVVKNTEEKEIKDKGYKAFVRQGMIEARKNVIQRLNKSDEIKTIQDLQDLKTDLITDSSSQEILGLNHMPDKDLLECIKGISSVNHYLDKNQSAFLIQRDENIKLKKDFKEPDVSEILTEYTEIKKDIALQFLIKKPDYIGNSKWDLIDMEGRSFSAKIHDEEWLNKFQNHNLPEDQFPFPQDILHGKGDLSIKRDKHGLEITREYTIHKIIKVTQTNRSRTENFDF